MTCEELIFSEISDRDTLSSLAWVSLKPGHVDRGILLTF